MVTGCLAEAFMFGGGIGIKNMEGSAKNDIRLRHRAERKKDVRVPSISHTTQPTIHTTQKYGNSVF